MPILRAEPFLKNYYATWLSPASCLAILLYVGMFLLPFIIAFASGSFWIKVNTFLEQPSVVYTHELALLLEGASSTGNPVGIVWSSNQDYNDVFRSNFRVATVQTSEIDGDSDGINDYMTFDISVPLLPTETINGARIAFFFQYSLSDKLRLRMQTLGIVSDSTALTTPSSIYVDGDLVLLQRNLLLRQDNFQYDKPVVNFTEARGADASALSWSRIVSRYADRDVRTIFQHEKPVWTAGRSTTEAFKISGRVRYPRQAVRYLPGLWEVLKYGWIQYLAYFILVGTILHWVMGLAYHRQIVRTSMRVDPLPRYSGFKEHAF
ncbi:hypothetical protein PhCBS80983_g02932 [Powellomyces hirtus]|uniref:Transmembrane protein 231 n=1 Tax=Powellomyces hirtus TaxID=109895 RepID=A0A507E4U9_9FUNG|nr:hypothetical protein PhCBS80983_g02932 [Powellomyces hirtus]